MGSPRDDAQAALVRAALQFAMVETAWQGTNPDSRPHTAAAITKLLHAARHLAAVMRETAPSPPEAW